MQFFIKLDKKPLEKYSPRNNETAREKGIVINKARKEVITVPAKKGREPNWLCTGSQTLLV
jgi:hypothetical protein